MQGFAAQGALEVDINSAQHAPVHGKQMGRKRNADLLAAKA